MKLPFSHFGLLILEDVLSLALNSNQQQQKIREIDLFLETATHFSESNLHLFHFHPSLGVVY